MNINDLDDYEVIEEAPTQMQASAQSKPLNLSDLGEDYEVVEEPSMPMVQKEPSGLVPSNIDEMAVKKTTQGTLNTVGKGLNKVYENIGELDKDQLALIESDPTAYRQARGLTDVTDDFNKRVGETLQSSFDFTNQGIDSLNIGPQRGSDLIQASMTNLKTPAKKTLDPQKLPQPKTVNLEKMDNLARQKEAIQVQLQARVDSGIDSRAINDEIAELQKSLAKVDNEIAKTAQRASYDIVNPIPLKEYSKVTNIPEEILAIRPDLKNTQVSEEMGLVLKNAVKKMEGGQFEQDQVAKLIREIQYDANYGKALGKATPTDKLSQEISGNLSNYIKDLPGAEDYKKGQELSSRAIKATEVAKEFGSKVVKEIGPENTKKLTTVFGPDSKIANIITKGNEAKLSRFNELLDEMERLRLLKGAALTTEDVYKNISSPLKKEFPLSVIKGIVKEAKDKGFVKGLKGAVVGLAASPVVGPYVGGGIGIMTADSLPSMTQAQAGIAQLKGSSVGKSILKGAGKAVPVVAALASGAMAFDDKRIQDLSVPKKLGFATAETLNPIPFTDATGAVLEADAEYDKSGDVWEAAKVGGKAYVKPIGQVKDALTGIIKQDSNLPDSYDIRQMERGNIAPKKNAELMNDGKVTNVEGPELNALASQFEAMPENKAAQEYSRVLRSIISSPSKNKEAQLAVLNQQPAFRELVRKTKGQK